MRLDKIRHSVPVDVKGGEVGGDEVEGGIGKPSQAQST